MKIKIENISIEVKWWQILLILVAITFVVMFFVWVMKGGDPLTYFERWRN